MASFTFSTHILVPTIFESWPLSFNCPYQRTWISVVNYKPWTLNFLSSLINPARKRFHFFFCRKSYLPHSHLINFVEPLGNNNCSFCSLNATRNLHWSTCFAAWWDSKLFSGLIHPRLWLEPLGDCHMLHQQQASSFINLMGFIFITIAIYQAETVWCKERAGSSSPKPA